MQTEFGVTEMNVFLRMVADVYEHSDPCFPQELFEAASPERILQSLKLNTDAIMKRTAEIMAEKPADEHELSNHDLTNLDLAMQEAMREQRCKQLFDTAIAIVNQMPNVADSGVVFHIEGTFRNPTLVASSDNRDETILRGDEDYVAFFRSLSVWRDNLQKLVTDSMIEKVAELLKQPETAVPQMTWCVEQGYITPFTCQLALRQKEEERQPNLDKIREAMELSKDTYQEFGNTDKSKGRELE